MAYQKIELPISGEICANSSATVERTLKKNLEGGQSAVINFGMETATVAFGPAATDLQAMAAAAMAGIPMWQNFV